MTLTSPKIRPSARLLMALPIAALAFSLAACGGDARPTSDQVAEGIQKVFEDQGQSDVVTADVASCLADELVESDLSNETLSYIAGGEDRQKNEEEKALTTQIIKDNIQGCIAG
ncbi:hypothetical protein SRABI76_03309 [Microbacterium oxydans]|uniref:Lipoprotein n=1 Tax=Microbacterium oxydans TaxID=82380 RepID=A0A0F0LE18_9MICO|nr:hypothetical protein [Microbacterium oxydans]KJL30535.1 hypothetical protein RS83_00603 [Microbacterium oxydans]CAH0253771.1 hypothetical protein SRABI76_03309 [Microbacterium oxydans]